MINWETTSEEFALLVQVAKRVQADLKDHPDSRRTVVMDLNACHSNGCPLDFKGLLNASATDFAHDIYGIRSHVNRETGKLEGFFTPRFAANRAGETK
jgi:hypothetical protein